MKLPAYVLQCICALDRAGYRAYAVGGCVRDALLGLTPHDYDLCTDATPDAICQVFGDRRLVRSGEKHGTVGVVTDGGIVEITTFRTEGGYQDSRHPDWVHFVTDLSEDLARRDFTVNAMAYHPDEGLVDPFGGRQDLENRVLRAVGVPDARFTEDALRILRGVRFAVRFRLTPEEATQQAMLNRAPLMDTLARERVYEELSRLLPLVTAEDLLHFAPLLTQVIPELAPCVGFEQHTKHHRYDVFTHTAHVVGSVPPSLPLRWAALLHDIGKPSCFTLDEHGCGHFYGHAKRSAELADAILLRLRAPTAVRAHAVLLITHHMTPLEPDRRLLRRRLSQYGADTVQDMLALQRADFGSKGTGRPEEEAVLDQTDACLAQLISEEARLTVRQLQLDGRDLLALGFTPGPALGRCLNTLLQDVLDERLPNERNALLHAAGQQLLKEDTP